MSLRPDPSHPDSPNYSFSTLVQKALALATDAARVRHADATPAHMLLGLLRLGEGTALSVLDHLQVDPAEIVKRVEHAIGGGDPEAVAREATPYTDEAKEVLHLALAEARDLDSIYVGTEHLLLALLRQKDTIASQVLNSMGVHIEDARAETLRVWASGEDEGADVENFWDRVKNELLHKVLTGSDETLAELLRKAGAEETAADWARWPDGSYKTWEDLDWEEDAPALWKLLIAWSERDTTYWDDWRRKLSDIEYWRERDPTYSMKLLKELLYGVQVTPPS